MMSNNIRMVKIIKWLGLSILMLIALFFLLAALIYVPAVQNSLVGYLNKSLSESLEMDVKIQKVRLDFPLDLKVHDVCIISHDKNNQAVSDTVANIESIKLDLQFKPLLDGQLKIDAFSVENADLNTLQLIPSTKVKGHLGFFHLNTDVIDFNKKLVKLDKISLENSKLDIILNDSTKEDTTKSENKWKVSINELSLNKNAITTHLFKDSLVVNTYIGGFKASNGQFDLEKNNFQISQLLLNDTKLAYDRKYVQKVKGFDVNHILTENTNIEIKDFAYNKDSLILDVANCRFKEQCGFELQQLSGKINMDSTRIDVDNITLQTPFSHLFAAVKFPFSTFDKKTDKQMFARLHGQVGKTDIMYFAEQLPLRYKTKIPDYPLQLNVSANGNVHHVKIDQMDVKWPTVLQLSGNGYANNILDKKTLNGNVNFDATTYNIDFLLALSNPNGKSSFKVPYGLSAKGNVRLENNEIKSQIFASQNKGSLNVDAKYNMSTTAYQADISAQRFPISRFVPGQYISPLTGNIKVHGIGTDYKSPKTQIDGDLHINYFTYGKYQLKDTKAKIKLKNGIASLNLHTSNNIMEGNVLLDAKLNARHFLGQVFFEVQKLDWQYLANTKQALSSTLNGQLTLESNFKDMYRVDGKLSDIVFRDSVRSYHPEDILLSIHTQKDTTYANVNSGDFYLDLNAPGGYQYLMNHGNHLMSEIQKQLKDKYIDQIKIKQCLPQANIYLRAGKENIFIRFLSAFGYQLGSTYVQLASSPVSGINGDVQIYALSLDSTLIDTVRIHLISDSVRLKYDALITNNQRNPQYTFKALAQGALNERGADIHTKVFDKQDKLGIDMWMKLMIEPNGYRFSMVDKHPILGYKLFEVNDSNYIFLNNNKRLSADLSLKSDDGAGIHLYTEDQNQDALQDLTISLNDFNLAELLSVIPYTPQVAGIMNGDFHYVQTAKETSVSSDLKIKNFVYEQSPLGNISSEFVYMPLDNGGHYVDGYLSQNEKEIATITGTYHSKLKESLNMLLTLKHLPLDLANAFVKDHIIGLRGFGDGTLKLTGSTSRPVINGEILMDSAYMYSDPYGIELRIDRKPLVFTDSQLLFDDFKLYADNKSALALSGNVNFSNPENMYMDLKMNAKNYLLINAQENPHSTVYGKAYVNFAGIAKGALDALQVKGKLDVLEATDLTYILRDTPLNTDNQLDELVKFTDFKDEKAVVIEKPTVGGVTLDMNIHIDDNAHIVCALNADKSNYVDLVGGGDLRMKYLASDGITMTGKYILNNGEMKYSLPVIPLKTFSVKDGSYIEFTGDVMNPKLNITATEIVKSSVGTEGGSNRTVDFECGVVITKTLKDMGLEFVISAPQDMTVTNQLNTMGKEARGKIAVTMLTTGMYLADGNVGKFSMNNALTSFLQSQINNITGTALKSLDLSFGLDQVTDATGNVHTDYSFKFSKRLWSNRMRLIVGGKVSSGTDYDNGENTFFDNVSLEYRLNKGSTKYFKLFYLKNSYDWLEGDVGRYGFGFIWRRKLRNFKDIFNFKDEDENFIFKNDTTRKIIKPQLSADTVKNVAQ